MSDPIAKAERSKAKDARQMPAPDRKPKRKPAKKHKPWIVEYRWKEGHSFGRMFGDKGWSKFGAYRTKEEAETVIKNGQRKYEYFEYHLAGPI